MTPTGQARPQRGRPRIALLSTGGTIEKTYDPYLGVLGNHVSNLDVMLTALDVRALDLVRIPVMKKDSLDMSDEDHDLIAAAAHREAAVRDGVVVLHGTDRLTKSGERALALAEPPAPIVFTGAMRPFELRNTDALQNLTEALLAAQLLPPGVYCALHSRVLAFPGVYKDRTAGTFRHIGDE